MFIALPWDVCLQEQFLPGLIPQSRQFRQDRATLEDNRTGCAPKTQYWAIGGQRRIRDFYAGVFRKT
jgi:hypothetical protein